MDAFWIALIIIGSGLLLLLLIYFLIYLFRFVKYGSILFNNLNCYIVLLTQDKYNEKVDYNDYD